MVEELFGILAVGVAAAALFMPRRHSVLDSMRAAIRDLPGRAGDALWRSGTAAHGGDPEGEDSMSERGSAAEPADAGRSEEQETHDVPGPRGGAGYDPRPLEDKAGRSIAYLLIALLAVLVIALLAMVVFDVITVGEAKEFGVFLGPVVALVSGATGFYYAKRRN